jgi:hypothetical protein
MTHEKIASKRGSDGTVEVWLCGWHIVFPASDGRPAVARAGSPSIAPENLVEEIHATPFDSGQAVRWGSWIVAVTKQNFKVIPTDPEQRDPEHRYYLYRL